VFLLDTNVWVVYLRGKNALVRQRLAAKSTDQIALCSVVLGELFYGTLRSAQPAKNRTAVEMLIAPYSCLPFDMTAADRFAAIRRDLELRGLPIGPYDLQIAAISLVNACTLVTHNTAEFSRIPGLVLEDWESP
jgi:tRNA(fMet)-specific endonuclease VapC